MMHIPCGKRVQTSIEKIEAEMTFYFLKQGHLTVNERPASAQRMEAISQELGQLLILVAESIQVDYKVSLENAYMKALVCTRPFYINQAKRYQDSGATLDQVHIQKAWVDGSAVFIRIKSRILLRQHDWIQVEGVDSPVIVIDSLDDGIYQVEASANDLNDGAVGSRVFFDILDYTNQFELDRIEELTKESSEVAVDAVTLFMQYRSLFPLERVEEVEAGFKVIRVPELNFPLLKGDRIKFPKTETSPTVIVTVAKYTKCSDGDNFAEIEIASADGPIAAGTTGFVMDGEKFRTGTAWELFNDNGFYNLSSEEQQNRVDGTWPKFQTRKLFSDEMIGKIFEFHQTEAKPPKKEDKKNKQDSDDVSNGEGQAKNAERSSSKSERKRRSTGKSITGESKAIESTTNDSTTETLATAHAA